MTIWAARVREIRRIRGLTQTELAERIGISKTSLLRAERGERRFHVDELVAIAQQLDVELNVLLTDAPFAVTIT